MIEIDNITKRFGDTTALDGLSLQIPKGKITVICGPSGSGKSTLLRILAGLIRPDQGEIRGLPESVSMTFQDGRLLPSRTVAANILYGLDVRRFSAREREKRMREMAVLCQCPPLEQKAGTLSGGQQQRVALARALACGPDLVLLDESFSSLDRASRQDLQAELLGLQRRLGFTTVFVTHDPQEALVMADHVVVMDGGQSVCAGEPEALQAHPETPAAAAFFRPGLVQARGLLFDPACLRPDHGDIALPVREAVLLRQGPDTSLWRVRTEDACLLMSTKNGEAPGSSVYLMNDDVMTLLA